LSDDYPNGAWLVELAIVPHGILADNQADYASARAFYE